MASIPCRHSILASISSSIAATSRVSFGLSTGTSFGAGFTLPRLPSISIQLPSFAHEQHACADGRLEELREHLRNGGDAPFMIDNGMILRAVPKKKPSYRRTRQKLYAPGQKQIQPLENLVRCPACGHVKRSHFMCMHCFGEIKTFLKAKKKQLQEFIEPPQSNLDPIDERIVYPGKYETDHEYQLRKKDWVPKREEPLLFNANQVKNPKKKHFD